MLFTCKQRGKLVKKIRSKVPFKTHLMDTLTMMLINASEEIQKIRPFAIG